MALITRQESKNQSEVETSKGELGEFALGLVFNGCFGHKDKRPPKRGGGEGRRETHKVRNSIYGQLTA